MQYKKSILELPFFSSLVKAYLKEDENTRNLYRFAPTIDGLLEALKSKETNYRHRNLLEKILDRNYTSTENLSSAEIENISLLKNNGFAVTTAHQPNLFLGPLYIITKAASIIALANQLNDKLGEKKIAPIFVIGSEDHDKDELLNVTLFGKKVEWITEQKGAIGSMKVNESLISLLHDWTSSFGNLPYAEELKTIFVESYTLHNSLANAYAHVLKKIFGSHGLIVLDLNQKEVKEAMIPVFEDELKNKFSHLAIQPNLEFIQKEFSIQASPRDINLFEFKEGERVRIDTVDEEMIQRLHAQPENFSPNVILRPLMQQTVLPSIANIGGGAEVAYWLQLKPIFDQKNIDFPVILLRDIFSPLDAKSFEKWKSANLGLDEFFISIDELKKKIILQDSSLETDIKKIENDVLSQYKSLENILVQIDKSLVGSYEAEQVKLMKSIESLYGKAIKAEKKKNEDLLLGLEKIKNKVFENNGLIERKENFSAFYLRYGQTWIDDMIAHSNPLLAEWKLFIK